MPAFSTRVALAVLLLSPGAAFAQSSAAFPDPPSRSPSPPALAPAAAPSWSADATPPPYVAPAAYPAYEQPAAPALSFGPPASPAYDRPSESESGGGGPGTVFWLGVGMVGVPYATGLGIAAGESFDNASGWLALPVGGPWLALTGRSDPCDGVDNQKTVDSDVGKCVAEPMVRGMLVLDGVLQATGAVLMLVGSGSGTKEKEASPPAPRFTAAPSTMGRSGYGATVLGTF